MILASPSGSSFGMSIHKLRKSYCRGDTFATFQQTNVLGETVAPTSYLGRVSDSVTQPTPDLFIEDNDVQKNVVASGFF